MSEIRIELYRATTELEADQRERLIQEFDSIADAIWDKPPAIYRDLEAFYFNETTGLALAIDDELLVGYSIYKRVRIEETLVIHSASTTVRPDYQNRGLRSRFLRRIISAERTADREIAMLLAVRTRNPINWHVFSRCCESIVPDYRTNAPIDDELVRYGAAAAKEIYPMLALEEPTMIMRNAFNWLRFLEQPLHKDPSINSAFFEGLSSTDGIFAIGRPKSDLFLE